MPITVSKLNEHWQSLSPEEQEKLMAELHLQAKEAVYGWNRHLFTNINIVEEKAAIAAIQQSDPTDFQSISASK